MSSRITYQGPFIKAFHSNNTGAGTRQAGNPAGAATPYTAVVSGELRRVYLFIQNKGTTEIDLTLSGQPSTVKLYAGQSISLDNYNGGFSLSSYASATIMEAYS